MKFFILLFSSTFFSCQNRRDINNSIAQLHPIAPEEFYTDSLNIGKNSHNKIELLRFSVDDSVYVVIHFFSKQNEKWRLVNKYQFDLVGVPELKVELKDFNNDGMNDMTYISGIAARGANEVRKLFVYDNENDGLVYIKNSDEYPNLLYNGELNCIDAFLVYGGCSTVFLRIKGDSLKEFASVELFDGLYVKTLDDRGKERITLEDTTVRNVCARYKNFNPLIEYDKTDF